MMNSKLKRILGVVLNTTGATFAGSSLALAFMHGLPWLLFFTVLFLGIMMTGILLSRSVEKERNALYVARYRELLFQEAAKQAEVSNAAKE